MVNNGATVKENRILVTRRSSIPAILFKGLKSIFISTYLQFYLPVSYLPGKPLFRS